MAHDVVVLGATVAGLTVARRLASDGYDVVVLDPHAEDVSAAIGHGVAAIAHASTAARMGNAYGLDAVREHIRRNVAGMAEIRQLYPDASTARLTDRSLPGGDRSETLQLVDLYRSEGAHADLLVAPDAVSIVTEALCVDPHAYAAALRAAAVAAGAQVVHGVTVTHLTRREGVTRVYFRNNMAWVRDLGHTAGAAVVDTLGVSPWGRAARVGPAQWVPVVRCALSEPPTQISLHSSTEAWMIRPVPGGALVLGQKASLAGIDAATTALGEWVVERLGATDVELSRFAIDPSDHGRPIVGASAIPGGFYARGNGRGELMNGTASGYYLAGLLAGRELSSHALPPLSKLRAYGSRLRRRS